MKTKLAKYKTKLICTIGPASNSEDMIEAMICAGMDVARLNFSHGGFADHGEVIKKVRKAAKRCGKWVAIMADFPGPKMRIGEMREPVQLSGGDQFVLTTNDLIGDSSRVSITMENLPVVVRPGNIMYLNDGLIQLKVTSVSGTDIICKVMVGGVLTSRKGLNVPGVDLGASAFTDRDRECMAFAFKHEIDAIGQSFVSNSRDVNDARKAAAELGYNPFIIAKLERATVIDNLDEILEAADGVMVARGDLGIEIPIESIASAQKQITRRANMAGKPVIIATQMLESMTGNRRPTRAEATDVANAILDGADCVMLSGESAVGKYPLQAVEMLTKIAASVEPYRKDLNPDCAWHNEPVKTDMDGADLVALSIKNILPRIKVLAAVFSPSVSGYTPRLLTRYRLPVWILAVSGSWKTCRDLAFSYGVYAIYDQAHPNDWTDFIKAAVGELGLPGSWVIQTEGPSPDHPAINHKMELICLDQGSDDR
jgi:pyruvate kinase